MDERDEQPAVDDAARWRQICLRFHDLRRGAREFGLGERFDALKKDVDGGPAGWLDLDREIQARRQRMLGVAMPVIDLAAELSRQGIRDGDLPRDHVCPDSRCSRQEQALFHEPPPCDLLSRKMIRRDGSSG